MTAVYPERLEAAFPGRVQRGVSLARYTTARAGGPAGTLLIVKSAGELEQAARILWEAGSPFKVLGGGSNLLVADAGFGGTVLLNHAREIKFIDTDSPEVWAESGANFSLVARQAAIRGLTGLEWAGGIPGTIGGAVAGNAGAHDGDMAGLLQMATILHPDRNESNPETPVHVTREQWPVERLEYSYRSSILKRNRDMVVLSAVLRLSRSTAEQVQAKMDAFTERRRKTQPPGASMGSMFKNPPGDYAGRLIEAAGLKGKQIGKAQISTLHANFFVNLGGAKAADIRALMDAAQQAVSEQFGVVLEPEVEFVGDWR